MFLALILFCRSLYFREKGLQHKTAPNVSFVPQSDILAAIRAFLHAYTLHKPSRTNQNGVFRSPGELCGTVGKSWFPNINSHIWTLSLVTNINAVLPLWTQSAAFNPRSGNWGTFIALLDALRPLLEVVGRLFKTIRPSEYAYAEDVFLSDVWMSNPPVHRIPGRRPTSADCFSSLRLSANLALTPGPCGSETSESSGVSGSGKGEWVLMTFVGEGKPRLEFPGLVMGEKELRVSAEDLLILGPGVEVGSKPFVGESYQLEFFVPCR